MSDIDGWAVLELMGHRRLAGKIAEVTIAGAPFVRIDIPSRCTGVSAAWCPVHGDCTCPGQGSPEGAPSLDSPTCPLHGSGSTHSEEPIATQFYSGASIYCITPSTEETVRSASATINAGVAPVQRWEIARRPDDEVYAEIEEAPE